MHTLIVIGGGFALLAACLLLGHSWAGTLGLVIGAKVFIPLWLIGAFVNMWVGTTHGYSWAEEFPIFLGILAVPVVVAALVWWKLG